MPVVDFSNVGRERLPFGRWLVRVDSITAGESQSGNPKAVWRMVCVEKGPQLGKEHQVHAALTGRGAFKNFIILSVLGEDSQTMRKPGYNFDFDRWTNMLLEVGLAPDTQNLDNRGQPRVRDTFYRPTPDKLALMVEENEEEYPFDLEEEQEEEISVDGAPEEAEKEEEDLLFGAF